MRHSLLIVGIHVSFPYRDADVQNGEVDLRVH